MQLFIVMETPLPEPQKDDELLVQNGKRTREISRRVAMGVGLAGLAGFAGFKLWERVAPALGDGKVKPNGLESQPSLFESDGFQYYTVVAQDPVISPASFSLRVHGLVGQELNLSLSDLLALPQTELIKDFQCVTGWRVKNVPWKGVLLREILAASQVTSSAKALLLSSSDGVYTESLTLAQAMRSDVMVAHHLFKKEISSRHGGPVRLYVAPMYGYKSLKWLSEIEVVDSVIPGFWEERGYDVDAWIGRSNGRSDRPV